MPDDQVSTELPTFSPPPVAVRDDVELSHWVIERPARPRPKHREDDPNALLLEHSQFILQQFIQVQSYVALKPESRTYVTLKRILDVTLTLPALILLSPIMLAIVILIRLDSPGPAIFAQHRVGQHGRIFKMLKFRSMVHDAGVITGSVHKRPNDSRVTRVGRLLRQTSLDELPQLINVLRGEMSLVGPRPEIPTIMIERYRPWQYQRLAVPQGITGWWQVNGRGSKLMWRHTRDDIEYIKRASLLFDIKILFKTFRAVIRREGAF